MKVSNPLTVIAIFAGVAEAFATGALVLLPEEIQSIFVYFVIAFPSIIVIVFFIALLFKPQSLYAPSDYDNQKDFMDANNLGLTSKKILENKISESEKTEIEQSYVVAEELNYTIYRNGLIRQGNDIQLNIGINNVSFPIPYPNEAMTFELMGNVQYSLIELTDVGCTIKVIELEQKDRKYKFKTVGM